MDFADGSRTGTMLKVRKVHSAVNLRSIRRVSLGPIASLDLGRDANEVLVLELEKNQTPSCLAQSVILFYLYCCCDVRIKLA